MHQCVFYSFVIAFLFLGCEPANSNRSGQVSLQSTSTGTEIGNLPKCLNIVGGQPTNDYNSVVFIGRIEPDQPGLLNACTGTFIGPNTVITAAHCVSQTGKVFYSPGSKITAPTEVELATVVSAGITPKEIVADPPITVKRDFTDLRGINKDIAVLIFASDIAPATMPVRKTSAKLGDKVTLVGFGKTDFDDSVTMTGIFYTKRIGFNQIGTQYQNEPGNIYGTSSALRSAILLETGLSTLSETSVESSHSLPAHGDSGGPVIINGNLAGVFSSLVRNFELPNLSKLPIIAFCVDSSIAEVQNLLSLAISKGAKVIYEDDQQTNSADGTISDAGVVNCTP